MVEYAINPPQAWLFQLANALLLVSYLWPSLLALRLLLSAANLCFMLWGWILLPFSIDTVLWNSFFLLVNLTQAFILLWRRRPVRLDPDREMLYQSLFGQGKTHHIARADFKQLTAETPFRVPSTNERRGSEEKNTLVRPPNMDRLSSYAPNGATLRVPSQLCYLRDYAEGDIIAAVGTRADTLSVILRGCVLVESLDVLPPTQGKDGVVQVHVNPASKWRPVAILRALEFLDSPEWVARATQRRQIYSVQLRVLRGGARVLHWNSRALDSFLATRPELQGILLGVVGVDLARKVFAANVADTDVERAVRDGPDAVSAATIFHTLSPAPLEECSTTIVNGSVSSDSTSIPVAVTGTSDEISQPPIQSPVQALASLLHLARGTVDPISAGVKSHREFPPGAAVGNAWTDTLQPPPRDGARTASSSASAARSGDESPLPGSVPRPLRPTHHETTSGGSYTVHIDPRDS